MNRDATAAERLGEAFREFIRDNTFPCVGAKSALARDTLDVMVCHDLTSAWDDLRIHRRLLDWSQAYREDKSGLRSIVAIFNQPASLSEVQFERAMWTRIQSLADKDHWLEQPYDEDVSPDPEDPHFSLSFGGEAYFVVGLHPSASRPARRFEKPALVFNLHDQFEDLRENGRYERMREAILDRDKALAGTINPMLRRHGEASEAAQYSGRLVDEGWTCPFSDKRNDAS
ncbi:YqcI/YcgG family protein [Altererythrobacter sp. SALINAS58]|uniref:guanitoxin biosynthesis heme-dependent pre-guanitoxin N-hydroxylase GntA n=1 Tax=Alteripontixanthobacter muriae TaxID=2705546 RepID=UPI0015751148|nr:guanitoxin biosynthesis heme-dependent pre-guanitoxin N-hydroxylase GntA [Alteripontixanthobacter muriae]NTZ42861.1 YqcI/YcgG family protein [Alteripontixanthobacter muriae]